MVMSDFRPEVEIRPFCACAMHLTIIIGTVCLLRTWLWGRYHVPQNAFLVCICFFLMISVNRVCLSKTVTTRPLCLGIAMSNPSTFSLCYPLKQFFVCAYSDKNVTTGDLCT